ncbi:zinc ribbon domain-containing protein [Paenibacillus sp. YN15]|uniref:zinc ribbon domain-containing protein n=1 Tax=Paenibacillus sp. YN15 TaxID=1742774 RepID=UPI000DCD7C79|nr:zinc ribbon domain-containing protein [Paenibacillus sp. YN15]RAV06610.1 hypothetical protein DQG13_01930 [Paenibacillus sp. YN15]
MSTTYNAGIPMLVLLLLLIAIGYALSSVIRGRSNRAWLQGIIHFFSALKTLIGAILLTAGVVLIVYGFLEYNEQKNTLQGKLSNALSDKPDHTPIFIVIGGACLVILGLTLLLLKTKQAPVIHYVASKEILAGGGMAATTGEGNGRQTFCEQCGSSVGANSQFCSSCGAILQPAAGGNR